MLTCVLDEKWRKANIGGTCVAIAPGSVATHGWQVSDESGGSLQCLCVGKPRPNTAVHSNKTDWRNGDVQLAGWSSAQKSIRHFLFLSVTITRLSNRTSWSSGGHSCFVFWKSLVQISAQVFVILNFVVFFSPFRRMPRYCLKIRLLPLHSKSFHIYHYLSLSPFHSSLGYWKIIVK